MTRHGRNGCSENCLFFGPMFLSLSYYLVCVWFSYFSFFAKQRNTHTYRYYTGIRLLYPLDTTRVRFFFLFFFHSTSCQNHSKRLSFSWSLIFFFLLLFLSNENFTFYSRWKNFIYYFLRFLPVYFYFCLMVRNRNESRSASLINLNKLIHDTIDFFFTVFITQLY